MSVTEQWRPVVGFEGYDVSNIGRVRSWRPGRRTVGWLPFPRLLHPRAKNGYPAVTLGRGKLPEITKYVHTLVLEAFVGPRPKGMETRHGPGGRWDSSLSNISWGTHRDNMTIDFARDGIVRSRLVRTISDEAARELRRRLTGGESVTRVSREVGISVRTLYRIKNGEVYADLWKDHDVETQ